MLDAREPNATGYEDNWAKQQYLLVGASDERAAQAYVERDFPPEKGFVILSIVQLDAKSH